MSNAQIRREAREEAYAAKRMGYSTGIASTMDAEIDAQAEASKNARLALEKAHQDELVTFVATWPADEVSIRLDQMHKDAALFRSLATRFSKMSPAKFYAAQDIVIQYEKRIRDIEKMLSKEVQLG